MNRIRAQEQSPLLAQLVARTEKEKEDQERRMKGIVTSKADLENLPLSLTSIHVKNCNDYEEEELDFSRFNELESLKIEDSCFPHVSKVRIDGLPKLKRIEIASGCFKCENENSALVVKNCSGLAELSISDSSFCSFSSLELDALPSLQRMVFGKDCFKNADLVVRGFKSLVSIRLFNNAFEKAHHVAIEGSC